MQQLVRGATDTPLETLIVGSDGVGIEGLTVTVDVVAADATQLVTGGAATDAGRGIYQLAATPALVSRLDLLTATWRVGSTVRSITHHEIISRPVVTLDEIRAAEPTLEHVADSDLHEARRQATDEIEGICRRRFAPRYTRLVAHGTGGQRLLSRFADLLVVREIVDLATGSTETMPSDVIETAPGVLFRAGRTWPDGPVIVGAEHGFVAPPEEIRNAITRRARWWHAAQVSAIPDRTISFTAENGATFRLAVPTQAATGDPDVDAICGRYTVRLGIA